MNTGTDMLKFVEIKCRVSRGGLNEGYRATGA